MFLTGFNHIAAFKTDSETLSILPQNTQTCIKTNKQKSRSLTTLCEFLNWVVEQKKDLNGTTDEIRSINNNSVSAVLIIGLWLRKTLTFDYSG